MISELNELYDKKTKLYNEVEMIEQLIRTKLSRLSISGFEFTIRRY